TGWPTGPLDLVCNPTRPTCATATAGITASDTCSGNITPVCSAGPVVTNGCQMSQSFTLTATDGCNNSATCQVNYTWTEDKVPPVFTPQPFSVCGATIQLGCNPNELNIPHCLVSQTASDDCSAPQVVCSSVQTTNLCANSATDGVRTRTVTYTAFDACKNTNICQQ